MNHVWKIDDREYERHEQRRGRRHAFEELNPSRTALVVVDMVEFFVAESPYAQGIVDRIQTVADALRLGGGTVAWVVPAATTPTDLDREFYGAEVADRYATSAGAGSISDRLWPGFRVGPADLLLEKSVASAFFPGSCDLDQRLREREIDTVLVTGTVANVCCEATARDARALGYRLVMVADAVAAPTDDILNATLRTIYRSFGDVRPAADVVNLFG